MCLHIWDSIQNIPHILDKVKYFDYATSFDRVDCLKHSEFKFRPLFYADEFKSKETSIDFTYDVSFCGTIHSDRYKILKPIKDQCDKLGLRYYGFHYLQSNFIYMVYKLTKREYRGTTVKDFDFHKKPSTEIASIVNMSKAVVDIQHPNQTGLTMRTIEILGMKKKFITTNKDIVNYDFYNAQNICVIDRGNPVLDEEFFNSDYTKISDDVYEKYSLECWVFEVLGLER